MADQTAVPVALALGSNMGDRMAHLRAAIDALKTFVTIEALSPAYETRAAYVTDQPPFLNAALIGVTRLQPLALLWNLKDIESEIGRTPSFRYGPRIIDIDILLYGDQIIDLPELTVPHKRMTERDFVLRPLNDIAPALIHPQNRLSVADTLARLPAQDMPCLGAIL